MLRGTFAFLVFLILTPAIALPAILICLLRSVVGLPAEMSLRPARLWGNIMLPLVGARVGYEGLENFHGLEPCVFVSNHQSNADIWVLAASLPMRTKFVAKHSLFRVPILGWAMRRAGFIPIDRGNRSLAIQSLRVAADRIRSGRSVLLFPEGTRSRDGRLKPFKRGSFHLAVQAGVPLIPVAISGTWELLPPGPWRVKPGPVTVRFLTPIDTVPYQPDRHGELLDRVRNEIEGALIRPADQGGGRAVSASVP